MDISVSDIKCRNCGASADIGQTRCEFCDSFVVISTFRSVYSMPAPILNKYAAEYRNALGIEPNAGDLNRSIAMCYLKLKLYDKASAAFEKAIENNFDNPESFFYAAIALLGGKKAFLAGRRIIDKALEYISAAIAIEPCGIYYYFLAYIKYDFFERKYLNTTPTYREALQNAKDAGLSPADVCQLHEILGVTQPEVLL